MKKIAIIGGGTFSPIRNHLSLCAPAFGTTAKKISNLLKDMYFYKKGENIKPSLYLTKMANSISNLKTNKDVDNLISELIKDKNIGTIILNVAFCDYEPIDELADWHGPRLKTSLGKRILHIKPSEKIIDKIRRERPDIFLVGFKTTTNATKDEQFLTGLKMMKRSKCNLVLANDVVTRHNMIITPEESKYEYQTRVETLKNLCDMIIDRNNLTYERTDFNLGENVYLTKTPNNFRTVLKYVIKNGGFIINNGNGFTPGHFGYKQDNSTFISSQRKVDHNKVFENGMTLVKVNDNKFKAFGTNKPSVGLRSQWLMFEKYPDYDCVIHTHNPIQEGSKIPIAEQKPFQCGSLECGMNTVNNLKDFDGIKAVYLNKHGANILFKSSMDSQKVINFIKDNIILGVKTN